MPWFIVSGAQEGAYEGNRVAGPVGGLWGVINGSQVFAPQMIARGLRGSGTADLANQRSGDHSTWSR
jgi:hypothetical protein